MRGLDKNITQLVPYDATWEEYFENDRAELESILTNMDVEIHHIGSTAIVGMPAKPVLGILVVTKNCSHAHHVADELLKHGKQFNIKWHYRAAEITGRINFMKVDDSGNSLAHIIIVPKGTKEYNERIYFHKFITEHPEWAARYREHKLELANKYPNDRKAYKAEKKAFCDMIHKMSYPLYNVSDDLTEGNQLDLITLGYSPEKKG
ncbi:MAG: GrpB family protein [Firmicutes bacterium]|nr:GrpB family protein [Bacillota bacterium]